MEKTMKKLLAFAMTLMMSLAVHAAQFEEGKHYTVLKQPHSEKPIVSEFFSFYCPHCFQFEPIIEKLQTQLPANTKFEKNHVSFMGQNMGRSMSKAYATMITLGVEEKMIPVMFEKIHQQNKAPKDDAELRQIFLDQGVDAKTFDAAFGSFAVDSMVRRFDKTFEDAGLSGVPSVIVNGQYLVKADGIKSIEEYIELVNYLLTK
jgi:thiol:disulfide interchange protein DsbA